MTVQARTAGDTSEARGPARPDGLAGLDGDGGLLEVVVTARRPVAEGVLALELARIDGAALPPFAPGSHVDLHLGDGKVRQYSLCGDPADTSRYRLGILRTADSRGGSLRVHTRIREGLFLLMSPPKNNFPLQVDAGHTVLFAGGIGITPLLAMARELARLGRSFEVHYRVRNRERLAFADELLELAGRDRLTWYTDDDVTRGGDGSHGRAFDAEDVIRRAGPAAHVYVCGPRGFMDHVEEAAWRAGAPEDRVHEENFANDVDLTGTPFTVVAARSKVTALVEADRTIADTLREHGVQVRTSCETGVCGTCLTRVLGGDPDHRDVFQSPAQQRANTAVTLCCSRSRSPELVVDI
ncbi:PDR/VanB family oxidoreductase [Streptomyces sp. CA-111067]|uniref:PDR/VanB family oxidoreductase n=1 Tax=Streptomyces sp. CA-111067 TaxID=3240046 RepID=UPI003D9655EE